MYSWLGEYWKEALAYIVILAYFLLKAALALATEVTEDYFSFSFWSLCKRHIIFWRFLDHIAFNVTLSKVNTGLTKSGDEFNYFVRVRKFPEMGFNFGDFWTIWLSTWFVQKIHKIWGWAQLFRINPCKSTYYLPHYFQLSLYTCYSPFCTRY